MKALGACKDPNIWGMEAGKKNPNVSPRNLIL